MSFPNAENYKRLHHHAATLAALTTWFQIKCHQRTNPFSVTKKISALLSRIEKQEAQSWQRQLSQSSKWITSKLSILLWFISRQALPDEEIISVPAQFCPLESVAKNRENFFGKHTIVLYMLELDRITKEIQLWIWNMILARHTF